MLFPIFLLFVSSALTAKIKPANHYFSICKISDAQYEKCIEDSMQQVRKTLIKGVPELNLPKIEPLFIPRIEMGDGTGNFKLHQVLNNLNVYGVSNYKTRDISFDLTSKRFNFTLLHPKLDFVGEYKLEGHILMLPIAGDGNVTFNFTDVTTTSFVKMEEFEKGGKTFLRVADYKLNIEPKHASSYFTNLFNGNEQLGNSTNRFLNENWKDAFYTYKELPEKAFSEIFKAMSNRVFTVFSKDELFPK